MVISSYFYIVKTINKGSPSKENEHNTNDLGSNNLVPHVHVLYLNRYKIKKTSLGPNLGGLKYGQLTIQIHHHDVQCC